MSLIIIYAVTLHFLFDWIFQSRIVATTKKGNPSALVAHICMDVIPYIIVLMFSLGWEAGVVNMLWFFLINVVSHGVIDAVLPIGKTERELVNWTAIDCILHLSILFSSLQLLVPF